MIAIQTKYVGPTNSRGPRIIAYANKNRVTVPYDHASNNPHWIAALALCKKMKWVGELVQGGTDKGEVFVFVELPFLNASPVERLFVRNEEVQHASI